MSWILLACAGLLEVAFAFGMKWSFGFSRLWPSLFAVLTGLSRPGRHLRICRGRLPCQETADWLMVFHKDLAAGGFESPPRLSQPPPQSGTFSRSFNQTTDSESLGARQSPRGDREPPEPTLGALGMHERLNWLVRKKRSRKSPDCA